MWLGPIQHIAGQHHRRWFRPRSCNKYNVDCVPSSTLYLRRFCIAISASKNERRTGSSMRSMASIAFCPPSLYRLASSSAYWIQTQFWHPDPQQTTGGSAGGTSLGSCSVTSVRFVRSWHPVLRDSENQFAEDLQNSIGGRPRSLRRRGNGDRTQAVWKTRHPMIVIIFIQRSRCIVTLLHGNTSWP